jgi:hypothetical protein
MSEKKEYELMYDKFMDYQRGLHEKNSEKIRIGLKVNILLPLVFLLISFITNSSKLVFLVLWIVSLFGISFYLLYVEFMDFKLQERMKEFGVMKEEEEQMNLIGDQVQKSIEELGNLKNSEVIQDIKELRNSIIEERKNKGGNQEDEEHS